MSYIIETPEGHRKVEKEVDGNTIISWEKIESSVVPNDWEDFTQKCSLTLDDFYIDYNSEIKSMDNPDVKRRGFIDQNLISTEQRARAMLAFIQLIRVRDYVNGDWVADWSDCHNKYVIINLKNSIIRDNNIGHSCALNFKTPEIRDQFLTNFRDLIEEAKEFI